MKIIFMGTPEFSVPTLQNIINSKHEVVGVVTQPDKPKGRGKHMYAPPVKDVAQKYGIPVYQPKKVKEEQFINLLRKINPDIIVVIAFGQILPKEILQLPKYGCINIHASLLPKYRGAAPIQWAIINGEKTTGITTMYMDEGLDTGDMLLKEVVEISDDETGGSLHDKLSLVGGKVLLKTIDKIEDGTIERIKQNDEEATYAPILKKSHGNINWTQSANEIERIIRGLNPWPSAYTILNGKILKIWKAEVVNNKNKNNKPGLICEIIKNKGIVVSCGEDALLITELQLQGKKRMDTPSFLRGANIKIGTFFNS